MMGLNVLTHCGLFIWYQSNLSPLVQVIAYLLFATKALPKPKFVYREWNICKLHNSSAKMHLKIAFGNCGSLCSNVSLRWRHNGCDGVSNHQPHHCLRNSFFGPRSKKHQSSASLAFVQGNHRGPVDSPHKGPVTRKMFPFDNVIMLRPVMQGPKYYKQTRQIIYWHHHAINMHGIYYTCDTRFLSSVCFQSHPDKSNIQIYPPCL